VSQYRDPLAAIRDQIGTKRGRVKELMLVIVPYLWALATPGERDEVKALRIQAAAEAEDFAAVTAVDSALDRLIELLEQIAASAEWFAGDWPDAPPPTHPGTDYDRWHTDDKMFDVHDSLDMRVGKLLGAPRLEMWGTGYRARGHFGRVPVAFHTTTTGRSRVRFRSSLRLHLATPCSITLAADGERTDPAGAALIGARMRAAIERLAPRAGSAKVVETDAKIAWASSPEEQRADPIPLEAMGALAALYIESWRARLGR
jgi:hypothetical protein